ncbi:MAG TPA: efflux RND transporter periplasmic adaptor subunit [Acidobacteriota bacterium]|nr:efflux RND transporter periplasmic adaptor subunit [Acidobacteriota bacterium]
MTVRVAPVKKLIAPITLRINGVLAPAQAIDVVSQLAGRITEVRFKVGEAVPAGAVVATIFPNEIAQRETDLGAEVGAARKDLQANENQLTATEKLATRTRELFEQDLIARRDAEQAESAAQTARAQVELTRARLAQQEAMLAQTKKIAQLRQMTAPISGVITRRLVEPGATIAPGSPVVSIARDGNVKFTGRVADDSAGKLRDGLTATVSIAELPQTKFDGVLTRVESRRDNGAAVTDIEIQINDAPLSIKTTIAGDALVRLDRSEEALLVPRTAINESGGKNYLFKIVDGRAAHQDVKLGAVEGDDVVIQQGVSQTDVVILDNFKSLKPGARVRPLSAAPAQ